MVLHMLLQFPLLLASGWALSAALGDRFPLARAFDRVDAGGLLAATLLSCVSAFWMLPAALDASLLSDPMRIGKYASWWLAGVLARRGAARIVNEVAAFFGGNVAWMLATAGLLYQAGDSRLCVSYLLDDQVATGRGLVAAALVVGAGTVHRLVRSAEQSPSSGIRPRLIAINPRGPDPPNNVP